MIISGTPEWGILTTYNGGGYFFDLLGRRSKVEKQIAALKDAGWLDKYTRAIFTDLSVYNAYVNLFSRISLLVEWSPAEKAFHSAQIQTFRLYG